MFVFFGCLGYGLGRRGKKERIDGLEYFAYLDAIFGFVCFDFFAGFFVLLLGDGTG
jgi:hypothetical protein